MSQSTQDSTDGRIATEQGVRLGGLLEDLLWPRMFEAVTLALRPDRMVLALMTIVLLALVGQANLLWGADDPFLGLVSERIGGAVGAVWQATWVAFFDASRVVDWAGAEAASRVLFFEIPRDIVTQHTAGLIVLGPVIVLLWGVGGVAISRSVACEFSMGVTPSWPGILAFAIERWRSVLGALLGPWIVIAGLGAIVWAMAWFVGVPWIGIFAALVFGIALILAGLVVFLTAAYCLGALLLVPAVACEGTDGIDAIQRTFARVLGRPMRLVIYLVLAAVIGVVAVGIVALFVDAVQGFAWWLIGSDPEGAAGAVLGLWMNVLQLLVASYALSYLHAASTIVYLILRQVADGQDVNELWMPGLVEGTMVEAMRARSAAGGFGGEEVTKEVTK